MQKSSLFGVGSFFVQSFLAVQKKDLCVMRVLRWREKSAPQNCREKREKKKKTKKTKKGAHTTQRTNTLLSTLLSSKSKSKR
jgi:hypothetical protein